MKRYGWFVLLALLLVACGAREEVAPSMRVIQAFHALDLEAERVRPMEPEDYGPAPQVAVEGTRFFMPFLGGEQGGRVMSFANQEDLEQVRSHYANLDTEPPPWLFVRDNILVQLHGDLTAEEAAEYEAALNAAVLED
jgi:hypothetical protein